MSSIIIYQGSEITSNDNHLVTPHNDFTFTIGNYEQTYSEDMNDIIALVINNGNQYFEQHYLFTITTLDAMIDIKKTLLKNNPKMFVTGLIIIPPNKELQAGINKLYMNKLSQIIDILDIVIFGGNNFEPNLSQIYNVVLNSVESAYEGFKLLHTVYYRHFSEAAYESFKVKRTINHKNDYEKYLCDHAKLQLFVDNLIFKCQIENVVLEMKKGANVYNEKDRLLMNYAGFDIIKDNKYYFVISKTQWKPGECVNIMTNYIKECAFQCDDEDITILIQSIIQNHNAMIKSDYVWNTKIKFNDDNSLITLARFYIDHYGKKEVIPDIVFLENYQKHLLDHN